MRKRKFGRAWWWMPLVLAVLLALAYFWYHKKGPKPGETSEPKISAPVQNKITPSESPASPGPADLIGPGPGQEDIVRHGITEEDYCERIEDFVAEFFLYLDDKEYVKHLDLGSDSYTRFLQILKRLSNSPPVPAGEGADPELILKNIYYFFRKLNRKDLRLIKEIINNEQEPFEITMDVFYRWATLGERCPDPEGVRLSAKVLYRYAGFFLNTTGGRAYLFRRDPTLRILLSYYSVLILYEADIKGQNSYGVDVFPFIAPLKKEISYYSDFEFQSEYLENLNRIESYYLAKR